MKYEFHSQGPMFNSSGQVRKSGNHSMRNRGTVYGEDFYKRVVQERNWSQERPFQEP